MDLSFVAVPVECDAYVLCATPVCGDLVVDYKGFLQVKYMFLAYILYTKVVDD